MVKDVFSEIQLAVDQIEQQRTVQRNLDGELFGYDRLLSLIEDLDHLSAADLAARVMSEVGEFAAGVDSDDDRAIVVLKPV